MSCSFYYLTKTYGCSSKNNILKLPWLKMQLILSFFSALALFFLTSCAHNANKINNVANLEHGTMAVVISGCAHNYKDSFIFMDVDSKSGCTKQRL